MNLPLPPYAQLTDFLPEEELESLLDWVPGNEGKFAPATIMSGDRPVMNAEWRVGLTYRDLGPLDPQSRKGMLDALPVVMAKTGATGPQPTTLELELAAHGTGRTIGPHRPADRRPAQAADDWGRPVLSSVLYFHAEPKVSREAPCDVPAGRGRDRR